jgi:hypothetical protein
MEVIYSCETSVGFQRNTWFYIPEYVTIEKLVSGVLNWVWDFWFFQSKQRWRLLMFHNMYYILAFCCAVMFNGFCRLCFRLRAALLCWFSVSFTTCFGLHGHLHVCRIFYFHMLEGFCFAVFFSRGHTLHVSICDSFLCFPSLLLLFPCVCVCLLVSRQMETCRAWPHEKKAEKKSREAESFEHMKIKYPTHLTMAM